MLPYLEYKCLHIHIVTSTYYYYALVFHKNMCIYGYFSQPTENRKGEGLAMRDYDEEAKKDTSESDKIIRVLLLKFVACLDRRNTPDVYAWFCLVTFRPCNFHPIRKQNSEVKLELCYIRNFLNG